MPPKRHCPPIDRRFLLALLKTLMATKKIAKIASSETAASAPSPLNALSAKERWALIFSAIGVRLATDEQLRETLAAAAAPQRPAVSPRQDKVEAGKARPVLKKTDLAEFFEQWRASGAQFPPDAERFAQIAKDAWGFSATEFDAFEADGTPQSDFIKRNIAFFFDGEESASKWTQKIAQKFDAIPKRAERAAAEALQQEKASIARGNSPHGFRSHYSAALKDLKNPDWILREHELTIDQYDTKARDADRDVQGYPLWDIAALFAIKSAFDSKDGVEMVASVALAVSGKKAREAREALGGLSVALPESEGQKFQADRRRHPLFSHAQQVSPALRGVANLVGNAPVWLDQETTDWLLREAREAKMFRPLANAELVRLAFCAPNLLPAFESHIAGRLSSPLAQNKGRMSSERGEPLFDELFPGWDRSQGAPSAVGELSPAQMAKQTKKQEEAVWEQARKEGPLGELAVRAAQIYGLSAVDGASLIGEAKKALAQEAGWTNGVWRLAANNPEFAQLSAQALAEQIESSSQRLRDHDNAQRKRDLRDLRNSGSRPIASTQEKLELVEARKKSGVEMTRWFVEKKAELEASSIARALMSIGQTAIMRGGLDAAFLDFSRFASAPLLLKTYQASQAKDWTINLLAGAASHLKEGSEAAIMQAINDQKACQELSSQWAAALAEGYSRAKKVAQKEVDNPPEPQEEEAARGRAHGGGGRERDQAQSSFGAEKGDDYVNHLAQEKFVALLNQLRDCVVAAPGFMQALPKKFNWGFLMNAQERWHAQMRELQFSKQTASHLKWAPVATDFQDGRFEAVALKNSRDLFDEGKIMSHCVFSYADRCEAGTTRIVSIRRDEQRVATLELFPLNAKGQKIKLDPEGANAHEVAKWGRGQNNGPHNGAISDAAILAFCDEYQAHLAEHAKKMKESRRAVAASSNEALDELSGVAPIPGSVAGKAKQANEAAGQAPARRARAGGP